MVPGQPPMAGSCQSLCNWLCRRVKGRGPTLWYLCSPSLAALLCIRSLQHGVYILNGAVMHSLLLCLSIFYALQELILQTLQA